MNDGPVKVVWVTRTERPPEPTDAEAPRQPGRALQIAPVADLAQALQQLAQPGTAALVLDLEPGATAVGLSPDEASVTLDRIARRAEQGVPVLVHGAPTQLQLLRQWVEAGAADYLVRGCGGGAALIHAAVSASRLRRRVTEAEEQLAQVQRIANLGNWEWREGDEQLRCSEALYELLGLDPERPLTVDEIKGQVHRDDWPGLALVLQRARSYGEAFSVEFRIVRRDGVVRWCWVRAHVRRGPDGKALRLGGTIQDITDRKRAEEALRRADMRLKLAVDAGNVGLWDRDLLTEQIYLSPEWKRQLGHRDDELPNAIETWRQRLHPDDRAEAEAAVERSLAPPFPAFEQVYRLRHKDGSYRWIRSSGRVSTDEAGARPLRLTGCHVDITEQRQMLQQMERSEAFLTATGRMARVGGWELDVATRRVSWTTVTRELHEVAPTFDPNLDDALQFWHPEDRPQLAAAIERACTSGEPYDLTLRLTTAKGRQLWCHTLCQVIMDQGRPSRLFGTVQDVTETREYAARLEAARSRAQGYLDVADVMLVALDAQGRVTMINRRGCELLGYTEQEILGQDWFSRFLPPDNLAQVREVFERMMAGEQTEPGSHENPVLTRDGTQRLVAWRNVPLTDRSGQISGTLSSGEDITEQRELQSRLAQADRLSSMGMLAAGVAHELNNPLTYVLYNLETLAEDLAQLRPGDTIDAETLSDLRGRFEDALSGSQRIHETTQGLSTFSRVEIDNCGPVQLPHVLDSACSMTGNEIRHRARLVKEYGHCEPVLASEGRLCQVFINLLINAAHAIDAGDVQHNEIGVRCWQEGAEVLAEVRDSGRGIPARDRARLFEPFFTTKAVGQGSGLGLPISRNIVEDLGGRIEVHSTPGQGSRFTVHLPAAATRAATTPGEPPAEQPPQPHRWRVLVIDDEPAVRRVITSVLKQHEVLQATSGAEGKRLLEVDRRFDLVLCDVMMPDVTGIDLHRWLLDTDPQLAQRVVFISGGTFTQRAQDYLASVDNIQLQKPFSPRELRDLARQLIEGPREDGAG